MISLTFKRTGPGLRMSSEKQVPFAMSKTLNALARSIQSGVQNGTLERSFTIAPERREFMRRLVKIRREDNATKANLLARVRIEGPAERKKGGVKAGAVLTRHEQGGEVSMGEYPIYIPTKALRPTARSLVPRKMYPKALRLMDMRGIGGATAPVLKAKRTGKRRTIAGVNADLRTLRKVGLGGTFILTPKSNPKAWGIYQRVGSGKGGDSLEMLWAFRTRTRNAPRLAFGETSVRTFRDEAQSTFNAELRRALETAR